MKDVVEEIKWALNELNKEIEWRNRMLDKADSEDKRRYWNQRVEDAKRLRDLIEELWLMHLDDLYNLASVTLKEKDGSGN
jgi:hypothetical protein